MGKSFALLLPCARLATVANNDRCDSQGLLLTSREKSARRFLVGEAPSGCNLRGGACHGSPRRLLSDWTGPAAVLTLESPGFVDRRPAEKDGDGRSRLRRLHQNSIYYQLSALLPTATLITIPPTSSWLVQARCSAAGTLPSPSNRCVMIWLIFGTVPPSWLRCMISMARG